MSDTPERLEDRKIREAEACGDRAAAHMWQVIKANTDRAPELGPRQKALLSTLLNPPVLAPTSPQAA
ncbi:hypothetical protein ACFVXG_20290 [Kitasatospora sp. NPDC058162]|uniref:hypothetical protein n=1 Tax=Kitasatospora sp. NPDC058162 TaxID=3346362 RepID=UPI0036D950F2